MAKDLTGKRFGKLVAIQRVQNSGRRTVWRCLCDCGKSKDIMTDNLTGNRTKSCGCFSSESKSKRKLIDLIGRTFGRLTVLERLNNPNPDKNKSAYWKCRCSCGNFKKTYSYNLIRGFTNSCGCLVTEELKKRRIDFLGKRLGKLTVIQDLGVDKTGNSRWKYLCDCGTVGITGVSELKYIKSCGCKVDRSLRRQRYLKYLDQPINFLQIKKILSSRGRAKCLAQCSCGTLFKAPIEQIIANKRISCGCKAYNKMNREEKVRYLGAEKYQKMVELSTQRSIETFLRKYNVKHPSQDNEIALKIARKTKHASLKRHWKTKKLLVCQASWEAAVVDYLNKNKIDFDWQLTFRMPDGSSYRIDLYLTREDIYVEIKGYMREVALKKWKWFHKTFPNSELWTKDVLVSKGIKIKG
jgi:hypothetical protein